MYLKQLEWSKWSAIDEFRRLGVPAGSLNTGEDVMVDSNEGRTTPTKTIDTTVPPVTPSRHVAATTAAVKTIANPPQPRKSPIKGRTTVEQGEELDSLAALPTPANKPTRPRNQRSMSASKVGTKEAIEAASVESSIGPTRQLRSQVTSGMTPSKASTKPGRIPKLTRAKDTNSTLNSSTRSRATGKPPPPATPSRLPTLVPAKRSYVVVEADSGAESGPGADGGQGRVTTPSNERSKSPTKDGRASPTAAVRRSPRKSGKLKLVDDTPTNNEWINGQEASSVVVSGSKLGERPLLRNVKRRRSSFSSVDVVA
jgi:cell division cycle 14